MALVLAGLAFGLIQVWRERGGGSAGGSAVQTPRLHATHLGQGQRLALILPVENQQPHDITIDALTVKPLRLVDHLLIKEPKIASALALEGEAAQEQVELPVTIGPGKWQRLKIETTFRAPLAQPYTLLKPFWWLLGWHRRYLALHLQNQNETVQTIALTVLM